ncbi:hypothetical protein [Endozoicomonas atrinae]|uniref:hypothetical protein n=1 Tax=Endozoicomonas atrinae TaxID=1333660 RepID=UPI000824AD0B|nr:hypothetical protein [Endozoicomonas atrinae]
MAGAETSKSKPEELNQTMHREHPSYSHREQFFRQDSKPGDLRTKELSLDVPDTEAETTEPDQLSLTPEALKGDNAADTLLTAPGKGHSQTPTLKDYFAEDSASEVTSTTSPTPVTTAYDLPSATGEVEEIIEETTLEGADHDQYQTQSPLGSHPSQRDRKTEDSFVSEPGLDTQPTKPEETEHTIAAKELPKALGESATDSPLTDPGAARSEKPEQTKEGIRDFFKSNVMGQISSFSSTKAKESDGRSTETVTESARSTDSAPAQFSEGHDPLSDHSQKPGSVSAGSLEEQHTITPDDGSATVAERKTSLEKRDSESLTLDHEPPETEATLPPHTDRPETTEAPMYLGRPNSALMSKTGRRDSLDSQRTTQSDSVLHPKQPPGFGSSTPRFKGIYTSPAGLQGFTARGNDTGPSIQMPPPSPRHALAGKHGMLLPAKMDPGSVQPL